MPQLLTSAGGNATKLIVNSDGTVKLLGSDILVANGDVVTGNVTAKTATLSANRNLTAVDTSGFAGSGGGAIALNANGNIITGAIDSSGSGGGAIAARDLWQGKFFLNQNFTLNNLQSIRMWDSKLKFKQMKELNNPPAELLVLSACRTALGDKNAELGFGGLAHRVAVKTAVASLWQVSDAGTLGLMTEFYKQLKIAPIKAEALRQAQIAMIKGQVVIQNGKLRTSVRAVDLPSGSPESKLQPNFKHPYYWSAFTMIGNPW